MKPSELFLVLQSTNFAMDRLYSSHCNINELKVKTQDVFMDFLNSILKSFNIVSKKTKH